MYIPATPTIVSSIIMILPLLLLLPKLLSLVLLSVEAVIHMTASEGIPGNADRRVSDEVSREADDAERSYVVVIISGLFIKS